VTRSPAGWLREALPGPACGARLRGVARGADLRIATIAPLEDVSLPFWCDWGYDWEERCYRLDGLLLKLVDGQEDFEVGGPLFPSSRAPAATVRPKLTVWYVW
jgi:hypothetical protein